MKFLLAFDSYKSCLSSHEIINIASTSIKKILPSSDIRGFIIADGGEGTLDALVYGSNAQIARNIFTNLEGEKLTSGIGLINDICVIECAQTVGLPQSNRMNIENKTTKGMGEQIKSALDKGYRKFAIGLGGSGTNDAGLGVIEELGYSFYNKDGGKVSGLLKNIQTITRISAENLDSRLKESEITILSDVQNPLYGKKGATYVYGPQKGVREDQLNYFDEGIEHFSNVSAEFFGFDKSSEKGAGAAGGLGYAFLQFFNAHAVSGVDYILQTLGAEEAMKTADVAFTGEGKSDIQTANGKVAIGVAKLAEKYSKPVLLISGALSEDAYMLHEYGIDYLSSIQDYPAALEDVLKPETAARLLSHRIEETVRLLNTGMNLRHKS